MLFSFDALVCKIDSDHIPVAVVLVVLGGVDHGASFDTDLLEQVPNLLVDVLLRSQWEKMSDVQSHTPKANEQRNSNGTYVACDDHAAKLVYDEHI